MAQYTLTYSCGHEGTVHLFGKGTERRRRIAQFEREGLCPDCYGTQIEADRAAASAAAAEANKELPPLEGTPKQVAWAEVIRAKALASERNRLPALTLPEGFAQRFKAWGLTPEDVTSRMETLWAELTRIRQRLETETSAKWWIDHRERIEFIIYDTYRVLDKRIFADAHERREREKREAEERSRLEFKEREAAHLARIKAEEDSAIAEMVPKARTFVVSGLPGAVTVTGEDIMIRSIDGRTARGVIDAGEWIVYEVAGASALCSLHPEMERIACEAKSAWEQSRSGD